MERSESFEAGGALTPAWKPDSERLHELRRQGAAGGKIAEHRAFSTLGIRRQDVVVALALSFGLTLGWALAVGAVCAGWAQLFGFWRQVLHLNAGVLIRVYGVTPSLSLAVPYLGLTAAPPSGLTWGVAALVTAALLIGSLFLPRHLLPAIYLLRAVASVQATALVFFALLPGSFPYHLPDYMGDMLLAGLAFLSLVPILLGFTYYLFDFSLAKKLLFTLIVMLHLGLMIPLQALVQAYLLYWCSLLFMPLLYLLFGLPLDVMIFVAFYGWGMSWEGRSTAARRPVRPRRSYGPKGRSLPRARPVALLRYLAALTGRLFTG